MGHESPCADARLRAALPPELYRVLHLRVVQRRTVEQTAAALRLSPHAVRVRQHRALEALRADLRSPGRSALS
ncbi:sigma factor-like helix-turn-helix DNA-binding protein [Tsukamurella pseudospumae]|uniref:RNA polymerase sigma factor n=1 Tax=Tsukamurella pseudospumae TaxID=239498 RepID=UPI0009ED527A